MTGPTRRICLGAALVAVFALVGRPASAEPGPGPVVFAAASLKNALDDVAARWVSQGHAAPKLSFAASNVLEAQIEQGAPADLFWSADVDWMEKAQAEGLIRPGTRVDLLANALVLVAPADAASPVALRPGVDLAKVLGGGRLAMGNVAAVPAGKYGKAALESLGAWQGVKDHLAEAESVRAALAFVARGEAPLGIVYATDAVAEPRVKVVGRFPPGSHPPIVCPVAVTASSRHPDAAAFLAFLRGPVARDAFVAQGFTVIDPPVGQP